MKKVYISPAVKEIFVDSESILQLDAISNFTTNPESNNGDNTEYEDLEFGGDGTGGGMNG